MKQRK